MNVSRREFLEFGAKGIAANELLRLKTGISLLSPLIAFVRGEPIIPFSPFFMQKYYFEGADRIPGFKEQTSELENNIISYQPVSLGKLVNLSLDIASKYRATEDAIVRTALLSLAGCGELNRNNVGHNFPLFIPDRMTEPWDKSIHAVSNAYIAFELYRLMEIGEMYGAYDFFSGINFISSIIGNQNIEVAYDFLSHDTRRNFHLPSKIVGLSLLEEQIFKEVLSAGVSYEILTTVTSDDEYETHTLEKKTGILFLASLFVGTGPIGISIKSSLASLPKEDVTHGLIDIGVNRDIVANIVGILLGIGMYRKLRNKGISSPNIIFDDFNSHKTDTLYPSVNNYALGIEENGDSIALKTTQL